MTVFAANRTEVTIVKVVHFMSNLTSGLIANLMTLENFSERSLKFPESRDRFQDEIFPNRIRDAELLSLATVSIYRVNLHG